MDDFRLKTACAGIYGLAFVLPVGDNMMGAQAFFSALVWPPMWPAWSANVGFLILISMNTQGRSSGAAKGALASTLVGLVGTLVVTGQVWGPGFWVWIGSMGLLTAGLFRIGRQEEINRAPYRVVPTGQKPLPDAGAPPGVSLPTQPDLASGAMPPDPLQPADPPAPAR